MRLRARLDRLAAAVPRCDPGVLRLAPEGHVPGEADRCPRCGGCHVLVIEEVVVEARPGDPEGVGS